MQITIFFSFSYIKVTYIRYTSLYTYHDICRRVVSKKVSPNRGVADDIIHIELSFLLETTNNVFYSILMYFEHIFFRYPSVNQDETLIIQFVRASKLNMLKFQISDSFYYCVII